MNYTIKQLLPLAEKGDAEAQARLAELYSLASNQTEAWKWANRSSSQNDPFGLYTLGVCYLNGYGTPKNVELARELFQKSADAGCTRGLSGLASVVLDKDNQDYEGALVFLHPAVYEHDARAEYLLALLHEQGWGVVKSNARAFQLLNASVRQGYIPAFFKLSSFLLTEQADWYDPKEGIKLLREAAEYGFSEAESVLGYFLFNGIHLQKNVKEAFMWCIRAAEKGEGDAILSIADYYKRTHQPEEEIKWLEKGCKLGNPAAMGFLSLHLYVGQQVPEDIEGALVLARKSAEQGNSFGQTVLGLCYRDGHGVDQDFEKANAWLSKAVNQDNPLAMLSLGEMMMGLSGYPYPDFHIAQELLYRAAEMGLAKASFFLGYIYEKAFHDEDSAFLAFQEAAKGGFEPAKTILKKRYAHRLKRGDCF